jgi:hypothetical protein
MSGPGPVAPPAVIDACCLIDVLASGQAEAILRASGVTWHLPSAVQGEILYIRQHDPALPGQIVKVPPNLSGLINSGVLTACDPVSQHELDRFVHYATLFRSDGEAMCLALAEARTWVLATDDRRAINVARQAGLTVVSCPELMKTFADSVQPPQAALVQLLRDIQFLAQFVPNASMPEYQWWVDQLAAAPP